MHLFDVIYMDWAANSNKNMGCPSAIHINVCKCVHQHMYTCTTHILAMHFLCVVTLQAHSHLRACVMVHITHVLVYIVHMYCSALLQGLVFLFFFKSHCAHSFNDTCAAACCNALPHVATPCIAITGDYLAVMHTNAVDTRHGYEDNLQIYSFRFFFKVFECLIFTKRHNLNFTNN